MITPARTPALPVSSSDCEQLAALHLEALPDSLVSELGLGYAKSFYRYLSRSRDERVFVVRSESGRVISGCVLSLRPRTLRRRLFLHTPLVLHAGLWLLRRCFEKKPVGADVRRQVATTPDPVPDHMPELILIFTEASSRCRGAGATLLSQCEAFLREAKIPEYVVRTVDDLTNRALRFYSKNGFVPFGQSVDRRRTFQVFRKNVAL
jgi:ribosomal protein S18 acetylase RimI-like enzyme